jgi:hypothetical protein
MASSSSKQETPFDFRLERVRITSDKFEDGVYADIEKSVTDIEIFEHLDKPYLTGTLAFYDDQDLYNAIDFSGAEKITIHIRLPSAEEGKVEKTFVIEKVLKNIRNNDNVSVIVLHLIEQHAFESSLINVNKAYTGKPVNIIQTIIKDNLKREFSEVIPDNQSEMRVIIPNLRPIEAAMWVRDRATTPYGLPYFFFSTLANTKLHIVSLEEILAAEYDLGEYRYSQAATQYSASQSVEEQSYIIQWFNAKNNDEILSFIQKGVVGAQYFYYDTMLGRPNSPINFDIVEELNKLKGNSIIKQEQSKLSYEDGYTLNGIPFNKLKSRVITNVVSTNVFDDLYTYTEEPLRDKHRQKIIAEALRNFLVRNVMDVVLPGRNFLNSKYSSTIGNQIKLNFLKSDVNFKEADDLYDKKKSGKYLIYALKHSFKRERYDVIASCVKLGDRQ